MCRILYKIVLIALPALFIISKPAFALSLIVPDEISQGSTLEILVPKDEYESIEGTFNDKPLTFYEILRQPAWDEAISRGEFIKLLFENHNFGICSSCVSESITFPDVTEHNPYHDYIEMASALDLVSGYEDGYFRPYTPITRAHIAKILTIAFNSECESDSEAPEFPDVKVSDWHYEYVNDAVCTGYFQGYPDGLMRPDRDINYNEAEIVVKRAADPDVFLPPDEKEYFRAFAGLHRTNDSGKKQLNLTAKDLNGDVKSNARSIMVNLRDYKTVSFTLPETKTELFEKEKQDNTWEMINAAKANPQSDQLWEGKFIVPAEGVITLGFGDKLYINGNYSGSHFGIDYANDEGTPIYASNSGIVTLSDETMSYGNTIIIDHGQNVFTMYLHMSSLVANEGDRVKKGDIIGYMGSTGIATGSHLHFNHFIGDVIVDSAEWY